MVYPGALHTRFHHAIGALHLLLEALEVLRMKKVKISDEEAEAVSLAVLLHDIGHGPFSHALENTLVQGITHEEISALFISKLNGELDGTLSLAIEMFNGRYHRPFFNQLISGQLDVDRLDYLRRDSFYTGVSEGVIGSERIIKMMDVVDDELVVEAKAIYSIEKFLIARRLMYWQVYLHKTVIGAEVLLVKILQRARKMAEKGEALFCSPALAFFLYKPLQAADFRANPKVLDTFARLDDHDIMVSVKAWSQHPDLVLSLLCQRLVNRQLFKIEISDNPFSEDRIALYRYAMVTDWNIPLEDAGYFVFSDIVENNAYNAETNKIMILQKDGDITGFSQASDYPYSSVQSGIVKKYFLCYPKELNKA